MSDISVIIVNYGTPSLTIDAVESVRARTHGGHSVDIHLVDNASPGEDAAVFTKAHADRGWAEQVTLYLEDENHGFGRGNNVVLRALAARAKPPQHVFFLNPDAQLEGETLHELVVFLDHHPQAAIAGASILRPDHTLVTGAFRFPTWRSEFASSVGIGPVERLFAKSRVALPADAPQGQVDWVSGAAFMMRFEVLQSLSFFDPDFFLYYEEVELMWRSVQAGFETWHVPAARVTHEAGAATGMKAGRHVNKAQPSYWYDSWRLYFVKTRGPGYARKTALGRFAGSVINRIVRPIMGKPHSVPLHFWRDFKRNVLGPLFTGNAALARPDGKTEKLTS